MGRFLSYAVRPLAFGAAFCLAGGLAAGARSILVEAPVLTYRYYGPVQGRIIRIDRSSSDAVRLTLDQVVLARTSTTRQPARVRISLHGDQRWLDPRPGMVIGLTGHLSPPSGPTEPGGFDFRVTAWFAKLGAVGYTRNPVVLLAPAQGSATLWLDRLRTAMSRHILKRIDGQSGAFAAAILTGDRAAIDQTTTENLRITNLAHLLAISGLHMGILTGTVFWAMRFALAGIPPIALRWPVRKIAAVIALVFGAAYLALSGGNVATVRAFIMVGVMFVAVLLDRRAVSLRSVAIAATIILILMPEELRGPGFQMSFAATVALVWIFGEMRGRTGLLPKPLAPVFTVVTSSLVAGLATAPVSVAHFGIISHFGLIANLLSVPLFGSLVMPAALLAAILYPVGGDWIAFMFVRVGIDWILGVASTIAAWDGSMSRVLTPAPLVLPVLTIGALFVVLWVGRLRFAGGGVIALAFFGWMQSERPYVLVSDTGRLIGLLTDEGRALSRGSGESFVAENWLVSDGDMIAQADAALRSGVEVNGRQVRARLGDATLLLVTGEREVAALTACGGAQILITDQKIEGIRPCDVYDLVRLRQTGSLAISPDMTIITASQIAGQRLWTGVRRQ